MGERGGKSHEVPRRGVSKCFGEEGDYSSIAAQITQTEQFQTRSMNSKRQKVESWFPGAMGRGNRS